MRWRILAPEDHIEDGHDRETPQPVVDEVVRQLRSRISAGGLEAGARLPSERALAETLGVGRPAVREALRELKARGLVATGRGRQGTRVASNTETGAQAADGSTTALHVAHLLELRTALEIQATALAVRRANAADLEALRASLSVGDALAAADDKRFHDALAAASHNPLLREAIEGLLLRLHDRAASDFPSLYEQPHRAAIRDQHLAILEAILGGDEDAARRSVAQHLAYVGRILDRLFGTKRDIRMLVCDLDGTLLAGPRLMTERTRAAIASARDEGITVVLASARPPRSMRVYHRILGLDTPVIAGNGALLWELESSIPLSRESIDRALAAEILEFGRSLGTIVNVESDDEWFAESTNERILRNLKTYGVEPPHRVGPLDDLLGGDEPIDKVFLDLRDLSPEARDAARTSIRAAFECQANVTETAEGLIDLVSQRASKAVMAQRLARSRRISADQVAAIGDHDNDVALLRWAGTGIAMGNATVAAKAAADLVTSSNLRDGAAEAVETWILGRSPAVF
ncbi:MAG: Cof-type HAD-IIB family hydrolase [Thermoleophilia bacterium]